MQISLILKLLGEPRDWPPMFQVDIDRIKLAIQSGRNVTLSDAEAQSFWEEYSDPDGWVKPESDDEVVSAYDRIIGSKLKLERTV